MIGRAMSEVISGADAESVLGLLDQVYGGQSSGFVNILQYASPGNNLKYRSYMVSELPVTEGNAKALVIQVTDFSDRIRPVERLELTTKRILELNRDLRQINEQLLVSALHQQTLTGLAAAAELRLRSIVHGVNAIICEVDACTGQFTFVSEQAETFLGYPLQRWTENGFWKEVIYAADYQTAVAAFQPEGNSGDGWQHPFRVVAADGSQIWLRNVMKQVKDADGNVVKHRCVIVDITQQHVAYLALIKDRDKNRAIAEALQYTVRWEGSEKSFGSLNVTAFYEPALDEARVGGDLFDAFNLPSGSVMLIVGDVTGKGLAAAAHTTEIMFAIRAFAQDYQDPADTLTRLNEFMCDSHRSDDDAGSSLAVLSLVVVDPASGVMHAASAGAEPPLIVRASGAVEEVHVRGLIMGINRDAQYQATDISLEASDTLIMTTDGITEARRGGDLFGLDRVGEVARSAVKSGTLHDIGTAILEAARVHGGGRFGDDVCLVLARRSHNV
ncbi:MAG: SpoIIE family protein phosphatase [Capsulimonadaceae bacterium]